MNAQMPGLVRLLVAAVVSPRLIAVVAAFAVAMAIVHDAARVAQRGNEVGARVTTAKAALLADAAAVAAWRGGAEAVPGFQVRSDGARVLVSGSLPDGQPLAFHGRVLPGAAPSAFARALTTGAGVPGDATAPPVRLDAAALERAIPAGTSAVFRRDAGIALLHWRSGTDADDFVFAATAGAVSLAALGDLAVLPGHLWIEAGDAPLVLDVPRDLVLVVQGNLYLLRSLQVRGPGRLVLVAAATGGGAPFADVDGNGRWSAADRSLGGSSCQGAIEGAGNLYAGDLAGAPVRCAAGLVAHGELHLRADLHCAGPVVVGFGITRLRAEARLDAEGAWGFDAEREAVPGFATTGGARPGRLLRSHAGDPQVSRMRELPLYLAAPAR